jgi:hypothetical protein
LREPEIARLGKFVNVANRLVLHRVAGFEIGRNHGLQLFVGEQRRHRIGRNRGFNRARRVALNHRSALLERPDKPDFELFRRRCIPHMNLAEIRPPLRRKRAPALVINDLRRIVRLDAIGGLHQLDFVVARRRPPQAEGRGNRRNQPETKAHLIENPEKLPHVSRRRADCRAPCADLPQRLRDFPNRAQVNHLGLLVYPGRNYTTLTMHGPNAC